MSVQNPERLATKQDLKDMYDRIRPYMGGLVTSKAGFTPVGTVISVMGTTAPVNYLACDGTVYNIADYTELANYFNEQFGSTNFFGGNGTTTFAVPDLRGEFLRGTGTNSHTNQGSGSAVGTHQDATYIPNLLSDKNISYIQSKTDFNVGITNYDSLINNTAGRYVKILNSQSVQTQPSETYGGTTTVRPTNTSVLYCIATKNFYIDPTLDYSTDEKIIGTWITGEPLYQRTFSLSSVSVSSGTSEINITDFTGLTFINACGYIKYSDNTYYSVPYTDSAEYCYVAKYGSRSNLQLIYHRNSGNATFDVLITVQYTKTT